MPKAKKFQIADRVKPGEELILDMDVPKSPELADDVLKYLCPACTQIAFYTHSAYLQGAHIRYCPHCNRELAPLQPENLVVVSPEEAENVGEI